MFNLIKQKFGKIWPIEVNEIVPSGNTNLKIAILITFQKKSLFIFHRKVLARLRPENFEPISDFIDDSPSHTPDRAVGM